MLIIVSLNLSLSECSLDFSKVVSQEWPNIKITAAFTEKDVMFSNALIVVKSATHFSIVILKYSFFIQETL